MAKEIPNIYLWFTSTRSGDHCNTIGASASAIAREMVEGMEENLGRVINLAKNDKADRKLSEGERILAIYERISKLKKGGESIYIDFEHESWSTITLIDIDSLNNVQRILGNKHPIVINFPEVKEIKKKSRKQS